MRPWLHSSALACSTLGPQALVVVSLPPSMTSAQARPYTLMPGSQRHTMPAQTCMRMTTANPPEVLVVVFRWPFMSFLFMPVVDGLSFIVLSILAKHVLVGYG
jgi:hypothetical protein